MSMLVRNLIVTVVLLAFANLVNAQTYITGNETKKADVNMMELSNYYKEHPLPLVRKMPLDEDNEEERPKPFKPSPSEIHLIQREYNKGTGEHGPDLPISPAPTDTFQSTLSGGTTIPPDTHGAVDSNYCVTAINTVIRIQTRGGSHVSVVGLDGFWSSVLPAGTGAFDPRVHYDPYYNRWILVTDAVNQTTMGTSTLLIAVSATGDPTGTWHMYAIAIDPTGAVWLDFPNVGFNNRWITVTGNMFGSGGGARVYIFDYASIMAGTGAPFTRINQTSSFSICPATTYDPTSPNMFAIESWSGSAGTIRLWKISGPTSTPTMTSIGYPATAIHWRGSGSGGGDVGPQVGTTLKVNLGDDRITNVIFRNNRLWCSHTAFLPATGTTTRSAIMWWQIDTLANPIQNGIVNVNNTFYAYPTIAVNANNDALIGFAALHSTIHPSAAYALRLSSDPADSIRPAFIFRHGQATYYETFGGTRNRWGDYSGTCVDPRNDTDFWTIQESCVVGTSPNWDTWWAKYQFCPKPLAPAIISTPVSLCIGASGTYKVSPIPGATSYTWSVAGPGWSSTPSTTDSINVTIGSGTGTIRVFASNTCGAGETRLIYVTPATVPNAPSISTITPACVGSPTAVFLAAVGGASSYSWQALDSGWSGTSGSSSFTATVGTGTGMVICIAYNACGASIPDTIYVAPAIVPTSSFSIANHVTNVNVNDVITFTGTAPAGSIYTWNFGGGAATPGSGAGPHTVFWSTSGTKTITLTINNGGCTSTFTDTVHVDDVTGLDEVNAKGKNIRIVPNPSTGSFKVIFKDASPKTVSLIITDMQGRTVYANGYGVVNNNEVQVSANDLVPGNYMLSINVGDATVIKKVTIAR